MNSDRRKLSSLLALTCIQMGLPSYALAKEFPDMSWDQLVPKDWRPDRSLSMIVKRTGLLDDSDPAVIQLMEKIRKVWDNAPTISELNGKKIRIAGYAVPLDLTPEKINNMLLVPYFGACVHTPPPPANQIIFGHSEKSLNIEMMNAVWLSGTLATEKKATDMGVSGYRLDIAKIEPYKD